MRLRYICLLLMFAAFPVGAHAQASFEEALIDVGNVGITVTNVGLIGRSNIRNNPTGPPSFEYPLNSGVEHLFEAGVWIGATRADGTETVRTAAVTSGGGYAPGAPGYEFASFSGFTRRSSLTSSAEFSSQAVSHLDLISAFEDTSRVLPNTQIQMPDQAGRLGAEVHVTWHAWNFPFTEAFAIANLDIVNISSQPWDSVYVALFHDLVVRNVNTTNDTGGAFFNKGGLGWVDSLQAMYAFNAGGTEETINTYGAISVLGAEWFDPARGEKRFFHPNVASEYEADGYAPPVVNPRWWLFSGGSDELNRPNTDADRYRRMATPFPNPAEFPSTTEFETARDAWFTRLRTDGQSSTGNWIGLTPVGPFPRVNPGDTLQVTFALVAAEKPEEFQVQSGKSIDTPESRALLGNNLLWARRTYAGEDNNFNGRLDTGEDVNGNGVLDRYLIPEPPASPGLRVEFERSINDEPVVALYWDRTAETSRDPVTGLEDFEGYRIYRSDPGDDRSGNIVASASLIAQYDTPGNEVGFNNGFSQVELSSPVVFEGDNTEYWYRFEAPNLRNGWQYLFAVTAFDTGDPAVGLDPFESSRVANSVRVFPGTPADTDGDRTVGVYPNPYRVNAAWDGTSNRSRKLNFHNLPPRSEIRIYTLAGELVKSLDHDADTYAGNTGWYTEFSAEGRLQPGGEHSWDLLSDNGLGLAGGLYLFTVKDLDDGSTQRGKFVIIK